MSYLRVLISKCCLSIWAACCSCIFGLVRCDVGENYGRDIGHGMMLVKNWMKI